MSTAHHVHHDPNTGRACTRKRVPWLEGGRETNWHHVYALCQVLLTLGFTIRVHLNDRRLKKDSEAVAGTSASQPVVNAEPELSQPSIHIPVHDPNPKSHDPGHAAWSRTEPSDGSPGLKPVYGLLLGLQRDTVSIMW
jgi:hypothetical protein